MMLGAGFGVLAVLALQGTPPVPGACTAPARENVGKSGCFFTTQVTIDKPPATLYWHIVPAASEDAANASANGRPWSATVRAHGRWWLYILSSEKNEAALPPHHVAGPFTMAPGRPIVARFMESWFTPGMRTRAHSHSGPEAFYVIDGEQCTETPTDRQKIQAGESYIVPKGAHLQAAPKGRRSLVVILAPEGEPWMKLTSDWAGTDFCQ
ncbi:cupin domain-containing protein [Allosphingosinicella deserti]|nr:cupin domain-containing protein [Sphingomonas deserti]